MLAFFGEIALIQNNAGPPSVMTEAFVRMLGRHWSVWVLIDLFHRARCTYNISSLTAIRTQVSCGTPPLKLGSFYVFVLCLHLHCESLHVQSDRKVNTNTNAWLTQRDTTTVQNRFTNATLTQCKR